MFSFLNTLKMVFNCYCGGKRPYDDPLDRQIYHVSRENKISILPITPNFDIENLYPLTDKVELWNTFVVGNDKTYILTSVNDPFIDIVNVDRLVNHRAKGIIPDDLLGFFDTVWDSTLVGKQLQFYMVWNSRLYFVNTYPFFNGKGKVIGAILFMRMFETMPDAKFQISENGLLPIRRFQETQRTHITL